jgi:hypothetical protein
MVVNIQATLDPGFTSTDLFLRMRLRETVSAGREWRRLLRRIQPGIERERLLLEKLITRREGVRREHEIPAVMADNARHDESAVPAEEIKPELLLGG